MPKCVSIFDNKYLQDTNLDLEVAYWRKCWGVRSLIYDAIGVKPCNDSEILLTRNNIINIIKTLKTLNKHNWADLGNQYWEWNEYKHNHKSNIRNLKRLAKIMKHNDIQVIFYDSY